MVDLLPNGLKSIKYLDNFAYEKIIESRINIKSENNNNKKPQAWHLKNLEGEIIRSTPLSFDDWFNTYNEGRVSISYI